MEKTTYNLGLDLATGTAGICLVDSSTEALELLDAIHMPAGVHLFDKADFCLEEIAKHVNGRPVNKIFVEASMKMFMPGFSSADTLITLSRFNCLVSYLTKKALGALVVDVNVTSARKAIGFTNTRADKRPVKEKVFEFVLALHPEFPWKKHLGQRGKNKNLWVYDDGMKDAADSWVVCVGGMRLNP